MIPDDIKRSLSDFADKVMEGGKQIGTQAQLQVQLKKLQVEHARRIHELGKHTYDWYRAGTMIVSGPVPHDVSQICAELDAVQSKIRETERQIEEAQAQSNPPASAAVNSPGAGSSAIAPAGTSSSSTQPAPSPTDPSSTANPNATQSLNG